MGQLDQYPYPCRLYPGVKDCRSLGSLDQVRAVGRRVSEWLGDLLHIGVLRCYPLRYPCGNLVGVPMSGDERYISPNWALMFDARLEYSRIPLFWNILWECSRAKVENTTHSITETILVRILIDVCGDSNEELYDIISVFISRLVTITIYCLPNMSTSISTSYARTSEQETIIFDNFKSLPYIPFQRCQEARILYHKLSRDSSRLHRQSLRFRFIHISAPDISRCYSHPLVC